MADTQRTIAQILTLLADNTSGDISPQDLRDTVVTLEPGLGGFYVTTPVATTFSDSVTPVKMLGTTTATPDLRNFTMPANNRLTYTGVPTVLAVCFAGLSITSGANNKETTMYFAKNGTVIADSAADRKIGTGSDVGRASVFGVVELATNDYVEVFFLNTTDTATMTAQKATVFSFAFII